MPETYPREIQRRRAKRTGMDLHLFPAESGVTLKEMSIVTILDPIKMLFTEPIVIGLSLYVAFIFGTIFQFFISIPAVLGATYNFTGQQAGIAFTSAITGALLAAATADLIDRLTTPHIFTTKHDG